MVEQPDAILCTDLHIREDVPICRTDDYLEAQWTKLQFITDLQKQHDIPVLCAGDVFHKWKISPWLAAESIQRIPGEFVCVPGQHDLPQHNLDLFEKSGLAVLEAAGVAQVMSGGDIYTFQAHSGPLVHVHGFPWGTQIEKVQQEKGVRNVCLAHYFVYVGDKPWPGCESPTAPKFMRKFPGYDLIVTGDNHQRFDKVMHGQAMVNAGSMMRMTADQDSHEPCVYLWNAKENLVEKVLLPFAADVVQRTHLDNKAVREDRIDAFIKRLRTDYEQGLDFRNNIKEFFNNQKVSKDVQDLLWRALDA